MRINLNKLKGLNVYEKGCSEPCGRVKAACFSKNSGQIDSLQIETLSLVPLSKNIKLGEFDEIQGRKVILNETIDFVTYKSEKMTGIREQTVSGVVSDGEKRGKLKDVCFDFETGEITDFFITDGIFRKARKLSINKMQISDNTIYIETKGGD